VSYCLGTIAATVTLGVSHNTNPPPPNYPINPPPPPFNNILHNWPPSPPNHQYFPPPSLPLAQLSTTNPKSPLAHHLQFAPWPTQYRATPTPKYHGNADPHKFLMSNEAVVDSAQGDEACHVKSLIISLEDAMAN
jgi:hypothetical protein